MNDNQMYFAGPGLANMVIRNSYLAAKGLYVNNQDCCDTLDSPQTPVFGFDVAYGGNTHTNRSYYDMVFPQFKMITGAALNKTIQSDANGLASWVDSWYVNGNYLETSVKGVRATGGGIGAGLIATGIFLNNNAATSTASNGNDCLYLSNQNATDGNFSPITFQSSAGAIFAGIYGKCTSHASGNGELYFGTRESGSWLNRAIVRENSWFNRISIGNNGAFTTTSSLEVRAPGNTSATYSARFANYSTQYALSIRSDREVIFDNLGGTGNRLLQLDASGIAARSSLDPATLVTGNIYSIDGTLTANRTVTIGNNSLRLDASTASNTVSNPLVIKGKADGTNETQAITFQNAAGNPLSTVYVTNTGTNISAAAGSTMTIGAGTYGVLHHENGYTKYPLLAVDPTVTNVHSALWFNSASSRYKYNKVNSGTTPRQVANVEDDVVGTSIVTTSSTYTLTSTVFRVQADANINAITITADGTMQEGYTYLVRCRRNGTNAITISAGAGYNLGVDGDSTLSPTTYTCAAYEILKITRYDTVIFVDK